jgi:hypothetical protein
MAARRRDPILGMTQSSRTIRIRAIATPGLSSGPRGCWPTASRMPRPPRCSPLSASRKAANRYPANRRPVNQGNQGDAPAADPAMSSSTTANLLCEEELATTSKPKNRVSILATIVLARRALGQPYEELLAGAVALDPHADLVPEAGG